MRPTISITHRGPVIANSTWTIKDAERLYNMRGWGLGFFRINGEGHVSVHPDQTADRAIDLYRLALDANAQGIGLPLLIRFSDILKARIAALAHEFRRAIDETAYEGTYTTVYPVKVNQQRHVIQEIVHFGAGYGVGLECGSKPELQAVLGLTDRTDHLIVCNGYKDEEFMRFALMGQRLGHQVFIVLEQVGELETVLRVADEMGVTPTLGVRIKLATEGSGRWAKSGGERSKFGLSAVELSRLLDRLAQAGRKDALKLVHFHLGSQITDIRYIKAGLEEIGRYYVEIREMGFDISHVDVGGGLGVDYEGSKTTRSASMNYTTREYANDVVYNLGTVCRQFGQPMPHLISESGRALTAHHALLLLNVTGVEALTEPVVPALREEPPAVLVELKENLEALTLDRVEEVFHDAVFAKERVQELFASDAITLRDMADIEQFYLATLNAIAALIASDRQNYPEICEPPRSDPGGPVLLQLLGVPVAPRQLGHRPDLPDHAGPPAARRADPARHPAGHHLRFRWRHRPVRRGPEGQALPGAPPLPAWGALHPGDLPHRRLPGNPGRPPQPVRRYQRGAHQADRRGL